MRHILALFAGLLVCAPICAIEKQGPVVTMTAEEDAKCDAGGGCLVVPRDVLKKAIEDYAEKAYQAGLHDCNSRT